MELRRARRTDLPSVLALLEECGLTTAGVADHFDTFWVASHQGRVVSTAGLEVYGPVALLRSVATHPAYRGRGLARRLCAEALAEAARRHAHHVYLLTTTASDFFERHFGFRTLPRSEADPRLAGSQEFRGACPDGAILMVRAVDPPTGP